MTVTAPPMGHTQSNAATAAGSPRITPCTITGWRHAVEDWCQRTGARRSVGQAKKLAVHLYRSGSACTDETILRAAQLQDDHAEVSTPVLTIEFRGGSHNADPMGDRWAADIDRERKTA